jgi:tRNA U34 5-methylaminomethyl-2-thiouridine-forming methyltransferase MnmC
LTDRLKKNPHLWNENHTLAVNRIKQKKKNPHLWNENHTLAVKKLPYLNIIQPNAYKIIETDASVIENR